MSAETVFQVLGLGEVLGADFLAVQLFVLAATAGLFAMSLAVMILSARSAGRARQARAEAEAHMRSAQDLVVEARQLSAQVDRAAARNNSSADFAPAKPIRVASRETTPEAEVVIENRPNSAERAAGSRNLDAAKEAATVPKNLLGAFRRRRS